MNRNLIFCFCILFLAKASFGFGYFFIGDHSIFYSPALEKPRFNHPGVPYETVSSRKDTVIGSRGEDGIYYRNPDSGAWIKIAPSAKIIAAADLNGDNVDDVIGIWKGLKGVGVIYLPFGKCVKLASEADWISCGDMNGDSKLDLVGSWARSGVYYRNSATASWVKMAAPANKITTGDLDDDNVDDLIGIWPGQTGVWVKYSSSSTWARVSSTADGIGAGDMNGDKREDFLGTWSGQGVYYKDSANDNWIKLSLPATQIAVGDMDGDGTDDLIGYWPVQGGVWVRCSQTETWKKISSSTEWISIGKIGLVPLPINISMISQKIDEGNFFDISAEGPGGKNFSFQKEINLTPSKYGLSKSDRNEFRKVDLNGVLLVVILLAFAIAFRVLFKTFWHPLALTSLVWLFSVAGSIVGPLYYIPLTFKTVGMVGVNFFALFAGALIVFLFKIGERKKDIARKYDLDGSLKPIFIIICILSLLGSLALPVMLYHLSKTGFLDMLLDIKSHAYLRVLSLPLAGSISYPLISAFFLLLSIVALFFAGVYFVIYNTAPKLKRYIFVIPLTNIILFSLIQLGRAPLIWAIMLFFSSITFSKLYIKKEKIKVNYKIVLSILIIILSLAILQIWRAGSFEGWTSYAESQYSNLLKWRINIPGYYSIISTYAYFCSPIPALSEFLKIHDCHKVEMGAYTFTPFFKYILGQSVNVYYRGVPPLGYNVFSYIREIYVDFGLAGLFVFNIILGFLSSLFFKRCSLNFNFFNLAVLSFLTTFLLYSLWRPLSSATLFWTSLAISTVIGIIITNKFSHEQNKS